MKRKNIIFLCVVALLLSFCTGCDMNFLKDKNVNSTHSDGNNSTMEDLSREKINVYIFYGDGCSFCQKAHAFFESIEDTHGKYYHLRDYEVWSNQENATILSELFEYFEIPSQQRGVPLIVIGEKYFAGYSNSYDNDIKEAIQKEYHKDQRTDVVEPYLKNKETR